MHEVQVNHLGGLSLHRKRVVRLTDRPDMTLDIKQQHNNNDYLSIMFFQCIRHDLINQNVKKGGEQKTYTLYFSYSDCSEPFFHAVINLDCTCSLVIELLNDSN